jgi:hypothetical protein
MKKLDVVIKFTSDSDGRGINFSANQNQRIALMDLNLGIEPSLVDSLFLLKILWIWVVGLPLIGPQKTLSVFSSFIAMFPRWGMSFHF